MNNNISIYRIGERAVFKNNSIAQIIAYRNNKDIDVMFDNGYISKNRSYHDFKNEKIKNLYHKSVFNVGLLGVGKYNAYSTDKSKSIQYQTWQDMLKRCYSEKYHKKYPTYKDCTVCEEWHNFQNFGKWFDENYYTINEEKVQLDKDILIKGNKTYSPKTCVFVPERVNYLFTNIRYKKNGYPVGVFKYGNKFSAQTTINNSIKVIGYFKTPEEAFDKYKIIKEEHVKQVADEYMNKYPDIFPQKLYDAMYKYEVEITD